VNVFPFGRFDGLIDTIELVKHIRNRSLRKHRLTFRILYRWKEYTIEREIHHAGDLTPDQCNLIAENVFNELLLSIGEQA